MELTDTELGVRWFDRRTEEEKQMLLKQYGITTEIRHLTDNDKEWIWRKQQKL
jgi:hypothetical protein